MPIYEFVCGECGYEFEKIQSFSAAAPVCVSCASENVTRQMGRPAIHFKGSGWYITDSKKGNGKKGSNNPTSGANGEGSDSTADTPKTESNGTGEGQTEKSSESKAAESKPAPSVSTEKASSPAKSETA